MHAIKQHDEATTVSAFVGKKRGLKETKFEKFHFKNSKFQHFFCYKKPTKLQTFTKVGKSSIDVVVVAVVAAVAVAARPFLLFGFLP